MLEQLKEKLAQWRKEVGAKEMRINENHLPEKADWRFEDRKD